MAFPFKALLSALALTVACDSSSGTGDSETHWLKCTTNLDCPSQRYCEAERCVPMPDAGAGGKKDAGTNKPTIGGSGSGGKPGTDAGTKANSRGSGGAAATRDADIGGSRATDSATRDAPASGGSGSLRDARSSSDASVSTDSGVDARDASGTADVRVDSVPTPNYCPRDAAPPDRPPHTRPQYCGSDLQCNFQDPGFDPCSPMFCQYPADCMPTSLGGHLPSPDYAPCDDHDTTTFAHPSSAGCPSNQCVGGANDGLGCTADVDCPGGSCFMNRCVDGPNVGHACVSNTDCSGGQPNADCITDNEGPHCNGGAEAWNYCHLVCVGGQFDGLSCRHDGDCLGTTAGTCATIPNSPDCPPAGRCVRWTADPTTGSCTAVTNNPFCNTLADCPTTKYCALDPRNREGTPDDCIDDIESDDCCSGGLSYGPCLAWNSCDTVNHVCVRTRDTGQTVTCGGTSVYKYGDAPCGVTTGFAVGTTCNDVCMNGRCTSGYAACR